VEGCTEYSSFCHNRTGCCAQNVPSVWISSASLSGAKSETSLKTFLMLYRFSMRLKLSEKTRNKQRHMCVMRIHGSLFILHVKDISGKCKRIGNRYNI
jgi:hypothetical protein